MDHLLVEFGREILKMIPGRVSTEIDASFSFDTGELQLGSQLTYSWDYCQSQADHRSVQIDGCAQGAGIDQGGSCASVRLKVADLQIASTWEGIQAAKELEREGIWYVHDTPDSAHPL
jgi:transaldolase